MRHLELAPAKLNLWLKVIGKRNDGFHEIETLMVPVGGICDELIFDLEFGIGDFVLECDNAALPVGEGNLVTKGIRAFESETGKKVHGKIQLVKRIPTGAGLGGGSSDAAATLRALNQLSGQILTIEILHDLASSLGSDVPFFLEGRPAVCSGRGEEIEFYSEALSEQSVVLVKLGFQVASEWAYSKWSGMDCLPEVSYDSQVAAWGKAFNDLERPVFGKHLALAALKMWLLDQSQTEVAMMSGSGSTMFAICRNSDEAEALEEKVTAEFGSNVWSGVGLI